MRIISKIEIKNDYVIKGINLEGNRRIGEPNIFGVKYYNAGIDEIIFMDTVASLYGKNNLFELIKKISKNIFIPITIGGGLKKITDISQALNSGADKVAINSAAINNPLLIKKAVQKFGSSTIVVSIETKKNSKGQWEVFYKNGREASGIELSKWILIAQKYNCGELLITSIDKDGTKKGFDLELLNFISEIKIKTPIIFSGGCGSINDIKKIYKKLQHDAIAISSILHFNLASVQNIKKELEIY